ncbi:unnamed protein product, partial [Prorocentrum cordatum]
IDQGVAVFQSKRTEMVGRIHEIYRASHREHEEAKKWFNGGGCSEKAMQLLLDDIQAESVAVVDQPAAQAHGPGGDGGETVAMDGAEQQQQQEEAEKVKTLLRVLQRSKAADEIDKFGLDHFSRKELTCRVQIELDTMARSAYLSASGDDELMGDLDKLELKEVSTAAKKQKVTLLRTEPMCDSSVVLKFWGKVVSTSVAKLIRHSDVLPLVCENGPKLWIDGSNVQNPKCVDYCAAWSMKTATQQPAATETVAPKKKAKKDEKTVTHEFGSVELPVQVTTASGPKTFKYKVPVLKGVNSEPALSHVGECCKPEFTDWGDEDSDAEDGGKQDIGWKAIDADPT